MIPICDLVLSEQCAAFHQNSCLSHCVTLFSFGNGHVVCIKLVVHDNGRGC